MGQVRHDILKYVQVLQGVAVSCELAEVLDRLPAHLVTEATLNRLLQHVNQGSGFAILSADRGDRVEFADKDHPTPEELKELAAANNRARVKLSQFLRVRFPGFIAVRGGWAETRPEERKLTAKQKRAAKGRSGAREFVTEQSYFLPNIDYKTAKFLASWLGDEFQQDGIVWGDAAQGIFVLYKNGTEEHIGDYGAPGIFDQAYTQLKADPRAGDSGKFPRAADASRFSFRPRAEGSGWRFAGLLLEAGSLLEKQRNLSELRALCAKLAAEQR